MSHTTILEPSPNFSQKIPNPNLKNRENRKNFKIKDQRAKNILIIPTPPRVTPFDSYQRPLHPYQKPYHFIIPIISLLFFTNHIFEKFKIQNQFPKNYLINATLTQIAPFFLPQNLLHSQQKFYHFFIIMIIFLFLFSPQKEKIPGISQRKISHSRPRLFLDTSISTIPLEFPTYIKKQKFLDSNVNARESLVPKPRLRFSTKIKNFEKIQNKIFTLLMLRIAFPETSSIFSQKFPNPNLQTRENRQNFKTKDQCAKNILIISTLPRVTPFDSSQRLLHPYQKPYHFIIPIISLLFFAKRTFENFKIKNQFPKNYLIYATLTQIAPFFLLRSLLHSQQKIYHFIIIMIIFLFSAQQEKIPGNFQRNISHQRPRRFLDTSISTIPLEFPTYIKKQKFLDSDVDAGESLIPKPRLCFSTKIKNFKKIQNKIFALLMFRTAFPERSSIFSQKLPNPNFQNRENLQNLKIKDQPPKNYLIYATLTRIVPFFSLQSLLHSQQIFYHFIIIMNIFLFFAQQEKFPGNFQTKDSHQ